MLNIQYIAVPKNIALLLFVMLLAGCNEDERKLSLDSSFKTNPYSATSTKYTETYAALQKNMRTAVTTSNTQPTSTPSPAPVPTPSPTPTPSPIPVPVITVQIEGTPAVGEILTVKHNISSPQNLTYQWLLDGSSINGATDARYQPGASDFGHIISLEGSYTDSQGQRIQLKSASPLTIRPLTANNLLARIDAAEKKARASLLNFNGNTAYLGSSQWKIQGGDITEMLQKALNDPNIRIIDLPAGTYTISTVFLNQTQNKIIRGKGAQTVLRFNRTTAPAAPIMALSGGNTANVLFTEFVLDVNWQPGTIPTNGFQFTNATNMQLYRVNILNAGQSAVVAQGYGHTEMGSPNLLVLECSISGAGLEDGESGFGILVKDRSPNAMIVGNHVTGVVGGMGIGIDSETGLGTSTDAVIIGNFVSMKRSQTAFEGIGLTPNSNYAIVAYNVTEPSFDNGISVSGGSSLTVRNYTGAAWNHGIALMGNNNIIVANEIHNIGGQNAALRENKEYAAIALEDAGNNHISNNQMSGGDMVFAIKFNGMRYGNNLIAANHISGYSKREFNFAPLPNDKVNTGVGDLGIAPMTAAERSRIGSRAGASR